MGGLGSGTGTKRPDHSFGEIRYGLPYENHKQIKHLKSLFSNRPDPSLHRDKRARDRKAGLPDYSEEVIALQHTREVRGKNREAFLNRKAQIALEARDAQDLARSLVEDAYRTLEDIMRNPDSSDNAKITAVGMILDRAFGKPNTSMTIEQTVTAKPAQLDDETLSKEITDTIKQVRAITGGSTEEAESTDRPTNLRQYN